MNDCENCKKILEQDDKLSEEEKKNFLPLKIRCMLDKELQAAFRLHDRMFPGLNKLIEDEINKEKD